MKPDIPTSDTSSVPKQFNFEISHTSSSSRARTAVLTTPHGKVDTPNFIFCGTKATIKGLTMEQMRSAGTQFILSNTYHLMIAPGEELVHKFGGLQRMTGWNGPMLTDSGGYQIFSMGHGSVAEEIKGNRKMDHLHTEKSLIKIDENGATFRSMIDKSIHVLTPERSIDIQRKLGADIILVLDECTPYHVTREYTEESMKRSHRWSDRSLERFNTLNSQSDGNQQQQALYGIVQGGIYEDLRKESCEYVNSRPFFGIAIGGSLGATKKQMYSVVGMTAGFLRKDCPVHLLGIGGIRDIFFGVRQGIDTFDCVHPTRLGRHGGALVMVDYWNEQPLDQYEASIIVNHQNSADKGEMNNTSTSLQHNTIKVMERRKAKELSREDNRERTFLAQLKTTQKQLEIYERTYQSQDTRNATESNKNQGNDQNQSEDYQYYQQRKAALLQESAKLQEIIRQCQESKVKIEESFAVRKEKAIQKLFSFKNKKIKEHVHLSKAKFTHDPRPIDEKCGCFTCKHYSRGYLHHLLKAGEITGVSLVILSFCIAFKELSFFCLL
jgi:queuine tRNA-ribosyltransferase